MRALEYTPTLARHALARYGSGPAKGAGRRAGMGALRLVETRHPPVPGPEWVGVRPRLSGICGSDQALFSGTASPYLATLTSSPFVPGHEVVGEIAWGPDRGRRVVVEPALSCEPRGIEPECPECASGDYARCRNVVDGHVAPGLQIGFCRDTGGGWSEGLVAHASRLHPVPDDLPDEDAVLVEPLACALHAVRLAEPEKAASVAVIGAGTIGLLALAALREAAPAATVLVAAKHSGQEHQARRLGADHTTAPDRLALEGGRMTGARRLVTQLGRELLLGGFDLVLDCVGTGHSLESALGVTRPGGTVVLVGMPGPLGADLALLWQRELVVRGAYGYRGDFPAAIDLARRLRPGRLIAEGWPLERYREALSAAPAAARAGAVKTVFDLRAAA